MMTLDSTTMLATRLVRPAGRAATALLATRSTALQTVPLRSLSSSLSTRSPPHPSTSRLTLDHDLGGEQQSAKLKPKGKAKTPPKNRNPKPLPEINEEELDEQFVRGERDENLATGCGET